MKKILLHLFSKPDCSLCVPFEAAVHSVTTHPEWQERIHFTKINIEENPDAFTKYWDKIPVLEINRRLAFKYRVTAEEIENYIDRLPSVD